MFLFCRSVEYDVPFLGREPVERDICTHSHFPAYIRHQRPHQGVPRSDGAFIDAQSLVRDQGGFVHRAHCSRPVAFGTRALAVERKFFCGRRVEMLSAYWTDKLLTGGNMKGRLQVMPVRASVAGEAGVDEPQAVEQFRPCAESAAYPGYAGSLVHGQGSRNIQHFIHIGPGCLCHPSPCIGGEGFEISS